ncbi:MAG TPA: LptF/LptG family permease [Anaeromyxobacteraceae bacterium]
MGTLERYLAREILLPFAAGLVFLTQVLVAMQILGQAGVLFGAGVGTLEVARVALDLVPYFIGYVLPVSFLLGSVVGVGRLADDREIIALGSAGLSPVRLVRVPLLLGLAVAALALFLGLRVGPWALRDARLRVNDLIRRNLASGVRGGVFYDELPDVTLYAEEVRGGRWSRVLISDRSDPQAPLLALAQRGRLEPAGAGEGLELVLEDGEAHREDVRSEEYVGATYRRAVVTLGVGRTLREQNHIVGYRAEMTPEQILRRAAEHRALGEEERARRWTMYFHRRIAEPLSVLAFAALAVPVAATRRGGRAFGYVVTLLCFVLYYAVMRVGEGLALQGELPTWLGPHLANVAFAAAGAALVALLAHRGPEPVR